ncbi:MAG: hypothetical protein AAGA21_15280 [Pseudomonadota bacterium]
MSIDRSRGLDDHALPRFERDSERKMNGFPGLDRNDILMALAVSGGILLAMLVAGGITLLVQGS